MNTVRNQQRDGFTIIEVVLVLAIGALIMLMVFLALPAMQRNQRDTTRKNDMSRLSATIATYKGQNRGKLPADWNGDFLPKYMLKDGDEFSDPTGGSYTLETLGTSTNPHPFSGFSFTDDDAASIYYKIGAKCDFETEAVTGYNSGARKVVIIRALEGGGVQCLDA